MPVVSFTFGCPEPADRESLQRAGCSVWVTVTRPGRGAVRPSAPGADALFVQGVEAGGHRGELRRLAPGRRSACSRCSSSWPRRPTCRSSPRVASPPAPAWPRSSPPERRRRRSARRSCSRPRPRTSPAHRAGDRRERAHRASPAPSPAARPAASRTASCASTMPVAPSAYPEVHHLTAPVRAAARERGDADGFHLWAGQAHALARAMPAADLVAYPRASRQVSDELRQGPARRCLHRCAAASGSTKLCHKVREIVVHDVDRSAADRGRTRRRSRSVTAPTWSSRRATTRRRDAGDRVGEHVAPHGQGTSSVIDDAAPNAARDAGGPSATSTAGPPDTPRRPASVRFRRASRTKVPARAPGLTHVRAVPGLPLGPLRCGSGWLKGR